MIEVGSAEDTLPEKTKQPPLSQHNVAVISSSPSEEDGICPTSIKENEEGVESFECWFRTISGEVVWEKYIDNDDIGRADIDVLFGATSDSWNASDSPMLASEDQNTTLLLTGYEVRRTSGT